MQTRIVILAAGKGTRMRNGDLPKVLTPFRGRPIIRHLLDAVETSGVDPRPVIVVGYGADKVRNALGDDYEYVVQAEQLGTGHAVICAESALKDDAQNIIVLYGDHPFVRADTISSLLALHRQNACPISMLTVRLDDFEEWRAPFADFGRIIRDSTGSITGIAEAKDATPAERAIHEVNPAFFCFDAAWLWAHVRLITTGNAKGEYYLTDLVSLAIREGACIASAPIAPQESIGINTPEHLEIAGGLPDGTL